MAIKTKTNRFKKTRHRLMERWHHFVRLIKNNRLLKWLVLPAFVLILLAAAIIVVSFVVFPPVKNYNFGVSFSAKRADELGIDYQKNFTALLDDLDIRKYRLMSYWDEHEATQGQLDFTRLDWQMNEAAKRGAKVSLSIGLRQPRWPECHEPAWAKQLSEQAWKQSLYSYIGTVVKRYENHPALESWQLENEYYNNGFGRCMPADRDRLAEEYRLVDQLSAKPIWLSLADQHGLPIQAPAPDSYGYSVYRIVYNDKLARGYMWYPTPLWYHHARSAIIKLLHPQTTLFIHELQLEPWGPEDTKDITIREQDRTMSQDLIHSNVTFARQIGFEDIYTWGGEWWYWRKETKGDYTIWEAVRREVEQSRRL